VEELYHLPIDDLEVVINQYPNIEEIVWLQEEPHNMGAWTYMEPRLRELAARIATHRHSVPIPIRYCGRPESASPAEGSLSLHKQEQSRILREVVSFH
jgi:2-oxoglutarate dehydrogenase E1 component